MSSKSNEILERMDSASRVRSAARPTPSATVPDPPPKSGESTRVGTGVVRRRAGAVEAPPPAPAPVQPRTILRRPAPTPPVEAKPIVSPLSPSAIRRPVISGISPLRPPPVVVEEKPEPIAEPAPVAGPLVAAHASSGEPEAQVVVAESTPEPELVAAPEPAHAVVPPPVAIPAAPTPAPTRATGARPTTLNQRPILPGLGLGVVSLPAGYDPNDPSGRLRRAREQAALGGPRWGPSAPVGGARPPGRSGSEAPPADDRRAKPARRGGRSEHSMRDIPESRHRRHKGKATDVRPDVPKVKRKVRVDGEVTVSAFAHELGVKTPELIKVLMGLGQVATVNQKIDYETAAIVAQELGHEVVNTAFSEQDHLIQHVSADDDLAVPRPPVVTVMGHVDHGKTTLLDTIRKAKVAAGEAGGITQHIGAYQVKRGDKLVTFIDTPGHSAFSAMRARGARVTDIVILVVAADDGVMPQTVEAINHAKAAKVPIVVAINKMDKPGVTLDRLKNNLMEHGLVPEEFGGDTIFAPVSALKGTGVEALLDSVLLVAEVADLKARPDAHAEGVVLESRLETGRGAVATLLVKSGTLKQGDTLVIGNTWGRVRAMTDDLGKRIKEAGPSTPVEIFGIEDVPTAGDEFSVVGTERDARTLAEHRAKTAREGSQSQRQRMTVDDLFKQGGTAAAEEVFHVVLKADVGGSLEALKGALEAIAVGGTSLKILHSAIGPVNESDVNMAAGNNGLVVAFNVKSDAKARVAADQHDVQVQRFDIIYQVIDHITARLQGLLAPVFEEQRTGAAEVRATFNITKFGPIAGCMVVGGRIQRGAVGKVTREGVQVLEGKLSGLKRFKEDVREVVEGFECGIAIEGYNDIKVGDQLEFFVKVEVPRV